MDRLCVAVPDWEWHREFQLFWAAHSHRIVGAGLDAGAAPDALGVIHYDDAVFLTLERRTRWADRHTRRFFTMLTSHGEEGH